MAEDSNPNLQSALQVDGGMSSATNPDQPIVGESCSQACRWHWPLRLLSIAIIAGGLALYGLLVFVPEITNIVPESLLDTVGFGSGHQCPSMNKGE